MQLVKYGGCVSLNVDVCAVFTPLLSSHFSRLKSNGGVELRMEN